MDSSLDRFPCVPAVMLYSEPVPVAKNVLYCSSTNASPPPPVPSATPIFRWSSMVSRATPAWASASRDAASAIGIIRGTRLASPASMADSGSKSMACAATEDRSPAVSMPLNHRTPLRPARQAAPYAPRPRPLELTTPIPVMTTERRWGKEDGKWIPR